MRDELTFGHALPAIVETFYAVTLARRFPNPLLRRLLEGAGELRAAPAP